MIFQFRMLSDENDNFERGYEVAYDMNLEEFHRFICRDLGFDPEAMASFFASNKQWEKLREYTLIDMGFAPGEDDQETPAVMAGAAVNELIQNKFDRLIYVFDTMGDRALFLEMVEAKAAEAGVTYPRVSSSSGAAPDQFDPGASDDTGSIFDDVMSDFDDFEGDDSYDEDM